MTGTAPLPPAGLVTPYLPQLVMTVVLGALAAAALVVAVRLAVRRGRAVLLAMLLGAAAGSLNEAPLDVFGGGRRGGWAGRVAWRSPCATC